MSHAVPLTRQGEVDMAAPTPMAGVRSLAPTRDQLSHQHHPFCVVCGQANHHGFQLDFKLQPDGSVLASFQGNRFLQGYPGVLHGGMIATLLDGAMTNCLFSHGCAAMTAELKIRYRHPVAVDQPVQIRASRVRSFQTLHLLKADLIQENVVKVHATAKFMAGASFEPSPTP